MEHNTSTMRRERFRIGSPVFVNESKLQKTDGFDMLFDGYSEFVYIPDHDPWRVVNGIWTGALGYLQNDMAMD